VSAAGQAKALWCPMVRIGVMPSAGGPTAVNDPTVEYRGNCIAGGCAMWRWSDPAFEKGDPDTWWPMEDDPRIEPPRPKGVPASAEWLPLEGSGDEVTGGYWAQPQAEVDADFELALAERRGFCGLAGRPDMAP
jgi:hypothetical protein